MKNINPLIFVLVILLIIFFGTTYVAFLESKDGYPEVIIYSGGRSSNANITIGKPYVYIGFDVESAEGHKDLILHFMEDEEWK